MLKLFLTATITLLVTLATLTACSDPTPAPETLGPDLRTIADGSPDADGVTGTHGATGGETHGRAHGDAGQYSGPRTDSNDQR